MSAEKGQVYVTDHAVTHRRNNKDIRVYVLQSELPKIQSSRETVSALTGLDITDVKYTYPAMARQVSAWIGVSDRKFTSREELIPVWHYQHCEPCLLPDYSIYDMRSAYWQIASKAKSLLCEIFPHKEKIVWLNPGREVERKWQETKEKLEPYKRLRLAIIGVNSALPGSARRGVYYVRGLDAPLTGVPPTWFSRLSLLTVRVAYELTQVQAQEGNAVYANADCVAIPSNSTPRYWQDYGIEYSTKGTGFLDCRAIGVWKCGGDETLTYDYMQRQQMNCLSYAKGYNYARPIYHEKFVH